MGTKCAPSYANHFMGYFENTFIYPHIENKSTLYLRYIDDIFMLWNGREKELTDFIKMVESAHPTIKFEIKYSFDEVNILDTKVKITSNN